MAAWFYAQFSDVISPRVFVVSANENGSYSAARLFFREPPTSRYEVSTKRTIHSVQLFDTS